MRSGRTVLGSPRTWTSARCPAIDPRGVPRTPLSDLRLHCFEILVEHTRQAGAVLSPMGAGCRLLESRNPVAIELVHRGVDAVAQQPAVTKRTAVRERRACRTFAEPGVPSQQ